MSTVEIVKFSTAGKETQGFVNNSLDGVAGSIIRSLRESNNASLEAVSLGTGLSVQCLEYLEQGFGRVLDMCLVSNYFKIGPTDFFKKVEDTFSAIERKT